MKYTKAIDKFACAYAELGCEMITVYAYRILGNISNITVYGETADNGGYFSHFQVEIGTDDVRPADSSDIRPGHKFILPDHLWTHIDYDERANEEVLDCFLIKPLPTGGFVRCR